MDTRSHVHKRVSLNNHLQTMDITKTFGPYVTQGNGQTPQTLLRKIDT